ncbi:MAG: DUF4340 domain-containing protein [Spirochaetia bacterium]|jgi:hypothetical protein|nr:DUF4340 domain-containing protein [Spirochaetia bacterium]
MSRNLKALVAALGLVAALIAGYFIAKNYKSAQFEERIAAVRPQEIQLSALVSDAVVKIEVPTTGIHLEKKGEDWEAVPPDPYLLDQSEIKGMTWSLSNMRADRIIEEAPKDLKPYGLDPPLWHTIVTTSDGKQAEFFGGERTPSRSGYYAMVAGDPKVYQVPTYPGERLYLSKKDIRDKGLPEFENPAEVRRMVLEAGKNRIQIDLDAGGFGHVLGSPYKVPVRVDPARFYALMEFFKAIRISDFDEDNPASLEPYGLGKPAARVFIQSETAELELLFGKANGSQQFAKLASNPGVFLIKDISPALKALAFDLVERSVANPPLDSVDSLVVQGGGRTFSAVINRRDGGTAYSLNGREIPEDGFRAFYGACAALYMDAEHPGRPAKPAAEEVTIEYVLNAPWGEKVSVRLAPYNRDFYALVREGAAEFLVSRRQVEKIFTAAEKAGLAN